MNAPSVLRAPELFDVASTSYTGGVLDAESITEDVNEQQLGCTQA